MEKPKAGQIKMERKKSSDLCRTTSPVLVRKKGRRKSSTKQPSVTEEVKECNDVGLSYIKRKESDISIPDDNIKKDGSRRTRKMSEGRRDRKTSPSLQSSQNSLIDVCEVELGKREEDIVTSGTYEKTVITCEELLNALDKDFGNKDLFTKSTENEEKENNPTSCIDNLSTNYTHGGEEAVTKQDNIQKPSPPTQPANHHMDGSSINHQAPTNGDNECRTKVATKTLLDEMESEDVVVATSAYGQNEGEENRGEVKAELFPCEKITNADDTNSQEVTFAKSTENYVDTKIGIAGEDLPTNSITYSELKTGIILRQERIDVSSENEDGHEITSKTTNDVNEGEECVAQTSCVGTSAYVRNEGEETRGGAKAKLSRGEKITNDDDKHSQEVTFAKLAENYGNTNIGIPGEDLPTNSVTCSAVKTEIILRQEEIDVSSENEDGHETAPKTTNDVNEGHECVSKASCDEIKSKKVSRDHFGVSNHGKVWQPPPPTSKSPFEFGIQYKK